MSGACESAEPTLCGCCEGTAPETPEPIFNPPGLGVVNYRVGTHSTFLASMLAELSSSSVPALASLRTRDPGDFSIALLDGWATCLDILTFYQERLVNESYLRTAVNAASVFSLAQLVGYQPSPGVAASAYLAFTLTSAPGSPDPVLIPASSRVQSAPAPGETPQTFETSSDLTATIAHNAIAPQRTVPWGLSAGDTWIWLQGTSNNINVGDGILFVNESLYAAAATNSPPTGAAADFHYVTAVAPDSALGNTLVTWDGPLRWPQTGDDTASVYVFRRKASLFGVQAPDPRTLSASGNVSNLSNMTGWPDGGNGDWVFFEGYSAGSSQINLDASYPGTAPAENSPAWTVLVSPDLTALFQVTAAVDTGPVLYTMTSKTTQLTLANAQVLVNNVESAANLAQAAIALAEAQFALQVATETLQGIPAAIRAFELATLSLALAGGAQAIDQLLADFVRLTRSVTAYVQSARLSPADPPLIAWDLSGTYATQRWLLAPVEGSVLALTGAGQLNQGQSVAIFGKRLRLQVSIGNQPIDAGAGFVPDGATGSVPISAGQNFLVDAFPPTAAATGSDWLWSVITPDGISGTLTIAAENVLLAAADKHDPLVGESAVISQADVQGPLVTLSFAQPLGRIYDRSTVAVNANVVAATQGETMNEIMGSGAAADPALQFTLKQSPLTYVSSPLNDGALSTLQVWVNNLRWHEVGNFLESGPRDRVFVTQRDAEQRLTVQFGDGEKGARTPTGQMNIRAVYRKGIGAAGNVAGGRLSQALDRPQGLSAVTNPDAAAGGADPDTADDARASAPLHVLTLDRVVSLEDYQNYALAFGGIARSLATWTWFGRTRGVFLTVAGAGGDVFEPDDLTLINLKDALWVNGNPHVPLQIGSYVPVYFEVGANIRIDKANYDPKQVLAQVWQSLAANLGFAQRQMGEGVAQSEIIRLIQRTPGVIAVELTALNRQGQAPPAGTQPPAVLRAAAPAAGQHATLKGAEMLLLDPGSQGNLTVWS